MALDVRELDDLELTLIPFLYTPDPDFEVIAIAESMASYPWESSHMADIRDVLPFSDLDVTKMLSDSTKRKGIGADGRDPLYVRRLTEIKRLEKGGTGYWMGMMTPVAYYRDTLGIEGVADISGWTSFATPLPDVIAHELGHNIGLRHAPACGASDSKSKYPYPDGEIGAWGYELDHDPDDDWWVLVPPTAKDFMSYCQRPWVSDYHYAKMIRQLLDRDDQEGGASARTIIVWGGVNADGDPYLESSFFMDATVSLPARGSEYQLRGMTAQGEEAFSFSFDMPEIADGPAGQSSFVFTVPVSWTGELGEITISGRGGSFTLNRDTDQPLTILYDDDGEIRAFLNAEVDEAMRSAMRSLPGVNFRPVFSRGIPR